MKPNFPLIMAVAIIFLFVGVAFAEADRFMPMRTVPEKYGYAPCIGMLVMLGSVAYWSYLAGRQDREP